jgi:hypothetical protein
VAVLRGTANRDFTGQGPARACAVARLPPPRSLAVEASPQPDRLEHLMSRARDDTGRSCLYRRSAPNGAPWLRSRQRAPLAQDPSLGSPHASSREGEPRSAAPEVPSTAGPPRERLVSFPQTVPSLWIGDRAPFRSHAMATRDGDAKREYSGSLDLSAREPMRARRTRSASGDFCDERIQFIAKLNTDRNTFTTARERSAAVHPERRSAVVPS